MEEIKMGFRCKRERYLESEGIAGVKRIIKELGVVVEYNQGNKEFNLLSDGYSAVRIRVKDGDFLVKIPAAENGLERDAFFVLNPAIALGCVLDEVPKKRRVKKKEKAQEGEVSPLVQMMRDTAEVMSSPEYEEAMSELRRAQAKMNRPFMESSV